MTTRATTTQGHCVTTVTHCYQRACTISSSTTLQFTTAFF